MRDAKGSAMPRVETIKGLERGIKVLQILQSEQISSLQDLHIATSYSKPSLLRILNTLVSTGLVTRRLADGHYRVSAFTDVVRRRDQYDRVAEAAAPVLIRLCEKVKWPSDLYVPAGDYLERRETSRPHSPFVLRGVRPSIGTRVGWLMTALGRAYLACCPEKEREAILRRLRKSKHPQDRLAHDPKSLDRILSEVRQRGYATRDPSFTGGTYDGPAWFDGGVAAIAVALVDRTRAYGSINILWIKTAFTVEQFAAKHLTELQDAAREIVSKLQR
jgi:IclR family transcriptional regulator, mhp operon transcriptional activator